MNNNITIKDVAKKAGVSISSVSRYLTNPNSINPIAAVAVSEAIKGLNYVPNLFAQNLKRDNSNIIAIIMPDISQDFFSTACKAMSMLFYQNNYLVMICDTDDDAEKERFYVDEVLKNRVAGIMIASSGKNSQYLENVIKNNSNIMLFDRLEPNINVNAVYEDNIKAGHDLAMHMIQLGYNQFSILTGTDFSINTQYRLHGIKEAFEEMQIKLDEKYVYDNITTREGATSAIEAIISDKSAPKCVIACNPKLLHGATFAVNKLKLSVPRDIFLGGFCIEDPRYLFSFPVPAILQDPYLVGLKSGELMLKIIKNKAKKPTIKQTILPTKLIY